MDAKQLVAVHAAQYVKGGMLVGLGTGSTANLFIQELARRYHEEGLRVTTVASSVVSAVYARQLGLPLLALENIERLDLYVDGADEVAPDLTLLKGRGSDLVREKLLAKGSDCFLVLVDPGKLVPRIGARFPIPVEVMPFAWQMVKRDLEAHGARGSLRQNASKDNFVVTAYGSLVLDMEFPEELDSQALDALLNATPGVVEHGVFSSLARAVFVGETSQVREIWADGAPSHLSDN